MSDAAGGVLPVPPNSAGTLFRILWEAHWLVPFSQQTSSGSSKIAKCAFCVDNPGYSSSTSSGVIRKHFTRNCSRLPPKETWPLAVAQVRDTPLSLPPHRTTYIYSRSLQLLFILTGSRFCVMEKAKL